MIRQSAHSLLSLLIMGVGKALFVLLTANLYGPAGQGIVTLGISVMVAASLLLGLGTDLAATYLVGRDPTRLGLLRRNALVLTAVSFVVAYGALLVAFRAFGDTVFREFPAAGFPALVLMIGLQILHQQAHGLAVGIGRFGELSVANGLQHALLVIGVVALHLGGQPVAAILYLWAAGLLVKSLYLLIRLPAPRAAEAPSGLLGTQLRLGPQMMMGNLTNLLNFRLDAYFIAYFLPAAQLGLYAVAATLAEAVLYLPKALGQVIFSWSSQRREGEAVAARRIRDVFLASTWGTVALVLLVQLVLDPTLGMLFGEDFAPALVPARILLVASIAYGIGLVAMNLLFGFGNANRNTRSGLAAVALNAIGNIYAIPRWGIPGAAFTSLVSYSLYCLLNLANVRRFLPPDHGVVALLVPDRGYLAEASRRFGEVWTRFRR